MTALVIAEHDNASIKPRDPQHRDGAAEVRRRRARAGGRQPTPEAAAKAAAQIAGVAKVIHADGAHFEHGLAENIAQVLAIASNYSHILFPATASGKNIAPRVAAKLDVAPDLRHHQGRQPPTPSSARSTPATPSPPCRAATPPRSSPCAPPASTRRRHGWQRRGREIAAAPPTAARAASWASEIAKSDRPELTAAKIIVSGGRALGSSEKFNEVLTPLADKLGAALGASRAAVDAGYAPNDWQVGQTGKIVAPQLYIAAGISGAIQHLAGMKDSKVIVAINKDPEAPIFSVADYGLEADLFTAVPELERWAPKVSRVDEAGRGHRALHPTEESAQAVADKLGVCRPTLYNWKNQLLPTLRNAS
jgi:electron transfer flavoprotein alpha subunit